MLILNCHIISETYLKSWKIPDKKESIYLFNKNAGFSVCKQRNIHKLRGTSFTYTNLYLLNIESQWYLSTLELEFMLIFNKYRDEYRFLFNNHPISNAHEFINHITDIDNWDIYNSCGIKQPSIDFKKKLYAEWEETISTKIEKYFDGNLENYWPMFLQYIDTLKDSRTIIIPAKHKDYLIKFFVCLYFRRFENIKKGGLLNITELVVRTAKSLLSAQDYVQIQKDLQCDLFYNSICLMQLYRYILDEESGNTPLIQNGLAHTIELMQKTMQIYFIIAPARTSFITSDSPCVKINENSIYNEYFSGIYFPISPTVCAYIKPKLPTTINEKYYIIDADTNSVHYINYIIANNSIESIAFYEQQVARHISDRPYTDNWIQALAKAKLIQ